MAFNTNAEAPPVGMEALNGAWLKTTMDALIVAEGARTGRIPRMIRRFTESEWRAVEKSGSIIVFTEEESGIKRWTDRYRWSASRMLGNFLLYREREDEYPSLVVDPVERIQILPPKEGQLGQKFLYKWMYGGSLALRSDFKPNGLMKKTITVKIDGTSYHIISYYRPADVVQHKLRTPSEIWELRAIGLTADTINACKKMRYPPDVKSDVEHPGIVRIIDREEEELERVLDEKKRRAEEEGIPLEPEEDLTLEWPSETNSTSKMTISINMDNLIEMDIMDLEASDETDTSSETDTASETSTPSIQQPLSDGCTLSSWHQESGGRYGIMPVVDDAYEMYAYPTVAEWLTLPAEPPAPQPQPSIVEVDGQYFRVQDGVHEGQRCVMDDSPSGSHPPPYTTVLPPYTPPCAAARHDLQDDNAKETSPTHGMQQGQQMQQVQSMQQGATHMAAPSHVNDAATHPGVLAGHIPQQYQQFVGAPQPPRAQWRHPVTQEDAAHHLPPSIPSASHANARYGWQPVSGWR
ncbi:hypothetical protein CERSUDRAFT_109908 [Gelatoporia subvermispora B]|uniref:Uncharacterized protein n=1 Tax=Ceriporiopsis subvermispora (strain B) TaxID=914234 RepID=M2PWV2_CERS8|nr:hypothetical protein CERSUDRAFT_109908 [Gelatoporia subvermispora B]